MTTRGIPLGDEESQSLEFKARDSLKGKNREKIDAGDEVEVTVEAGRILVEPSQRVRGKYCLEDLLARMPEDYVPHEEDWGEPVGREEW
jgi:antitoxin component of MazEF toxin-antitoxin module